MADQSDPMGEDILVELGVKFYFRQPDPKKPGKYHFKLPGEAESIMGYDTTLEAVRAATQTMTIGFKYDAEAGMKAKPTVEAVLKRHELAEVQMPDALNKRDQRDRLTTDKAKGPQIDAFLQDFSKLVAAAAQKGNPGQPRPRGPF